MNLSYYLYKYIKVNNITLQLLDGKDKLTSYKEFETKINEQDVSIFKLNKKSKVGLVYGINVVVAINKFITDTDKEIEL